MKFLVSLSRIFVGNLFIFSGLVKANDPLGFSYKLEEYFIEFGMDWAWLHDILVPLAAGICILEVILGVAVLVGYQMKRVTWLLLLMIVFFTILTFASAVFEIVRSCGCFGDAIPLTPWDSFIKDLILLVFILVLFVKRKIIAPFEHLKSDLIFTLISLLIMAWLSFALDWFAPLWFTAFVLGLPILYRLLIKKPSAMVATALGTVCSILFAIVAVQHLPFKDFRPYAIEKNLPEQMELPPNAKPPVYDNVLTYINIKTGEEKEFNMAEYNASKIWENKDWEWANTESKLIEVGDEAKITDLSILTHTSEDITDALLAKDRLLLIVAYDLAICNEDHLDQINELAKQAEKEGIRVSGISAAGTNQKNNFIKKHNLDFDFLVADGIVLKTIVRSNPGIIYLEKGTVKGKWHENDTPDIEWFK